MQFIVNQNCRWMDSNTVSRMSERMLYQLSHNHYQMATILNNSVFKWAIPGLFFIYFCLFKQTIFTTNICTGIRTHTTRSGLTVVTEVFKFLGLLLIWLLLCKLNLREGLAIRSRSQRSSSNTFLLKIFLVKKYMKLKLEFSTLVKYRVWRKKYQLKRWRFPED